MRNFLALAAAVLVALSMAFYFSPALDSDPLWAKFDPLAAIKVLKFGLGMIAGLPDAANFAVATVIYLLPPTLAFLAVRRWYRAPRTGLSR